MTKYKTVKLGPKEVEIPKDWELKELSKVSSKVTDGTHDTPKTLRSGKKFITGKHVENDKILFDQCLFISDEDHQDNISRCEPEMGDILFTHIGSIGKVAQVKKNIEFSIKNVALIKVDDETHSSYIKYSLKSKYFKDQIHFITQGGVQNFIGLSTLRSMNIFAPPLSEQRRIAEILSTVDQSIEQTDDIIQETKKLKKGLMQDLLTRGIGHTEFKKVKLGPKEVEIPEEWELIRLEEVAKKKKGKKPKKVYDEEKENTLPYLVNENLHSNTVQSFGSREGAVVCKEDEVLISWDGTIGEIFTDRNGAVGSTFASIKFDEQKIYYKHGYYFLKNFNNLIKRLAEGSTIPHVPKDFMNFFKIAMPSLEEQKQIAEILSSVDEKIEHEQGYKEKLEQLKKGLMQDLLTGKVRVKI